MKLMLTSNIKLWPYFKIDSKNFTIFIIGRITRCARLISMTKKNTLEGR